MLTRLFWRLLLSLILWGSTLYLGPTRVGAAQTCGGNVTCQGEVEKCNSNGVNCTITGTSATVACSGSTGINAGYCSAPNCPSGMSATGQDCYTASGDTCGNAAAPACNGACGSGTVCRFNQGNQACQCGTLTTCADAQESPNMQMTRLSPTSTSACRGY